MSKNVEKRFECGDQIKNRFFLPTQCLIGSRTMSWQIAIFGALYFFQSLFGNIMGCISEKPYR